MRCLPGSKILPQVANLLAYLGIGEFKFIQSHVMEPIYSRNHLRASTTVFAARALNPIAIMAQSIENTSPWAV